MAASAVFRAKRAFVTLLLQLAVAYQIVVSINRDSPDAAVLAAFRKVSLKVHPDKGGSVKEASDHGEELRGRPPESLQGSRGQGRYCHERLSSHERK